MAIDLNIYFKQTENSLIALSDCILILDMSYYSKGENYIKHDANIWVKSLLGIIKVSEDKNIDFILDYAVSINIENKVIEEDTDFVAIQYKANDAILEVSSDQGDVGKQITYVERLLGGNEIVKDPNHLLMKLLKIYGPPNANFDIVHLEILLSQILRNKDDIQQLARLIKPYSPTLVNIKKTVFSSSFIQGLAFENIGEAIRTGLIQEDINESSIIEKIVTGEVVEKIVKK